jgi:hypothetical protein
MSLKTYITTAELASFLEITTMAIKKLRDKGVVVSHSRNKIQALQSLKNYREMKAFSSRADQRFEDRIHDKINKEIADLEIELPIAVVEKISPIKQKRDLLELKKLEMEERIKLLRIEVDKKMGLLIDRDLFEKKSVEIMKFFQSYILALPEKIADEIHGEKDYWEIVQTIEKHLRLALEDLSRWPKVLDGLC